MSIRSGLAGDAAGGGRMGGNPEDTRNNSRREAEYGLSSLKLSIAEGIAPSIPFNGVTDEIKRTAQAGSPAF